MKLPKRRFPKSKARGRVYPGTQKEKKRQVNILLKRKNKPVRISPFQLER